jgi:uncharacterized membrane protein
MSNPFNIVGVHIAVACGALVTGAGALVVASGTKVHRRLGIGYLVCWGWLAGSSLLFASRHSGTSAFEVLAIVGGVSVAIAYLQVRLRKKLGRRWMRRHYVWMLFSLAALLGPTTNQLFWHLGLDYPKAVFFLVLGAPWLLVPFYVRKLDARYGFAKTRGDEPASPFERRNSTT